MWTKLKQFFAPPVFEDDDEKTRAARLMNSTLIGVIICATFLTIPLLLTPEKDSVVEFALLTALTLIVILAVLWVVMKQGHVGFATAGFNLLIWLVFLATGVNGGVNSVTNAAFLLSIAFASLSMGIWAGIGFTVLSISAMFGLYYGELNGSIPPLTADPLAFTITYSTIFFLMNLMVLYAVNNYNNAWGRIRRQEQVLDEHNRQLEKMARTEVAIRQSMEASVNEYLAFAQRVAQGDLNWRLALDGSSHYDPLMVLGENLNVLVDWLAQANRQLERMAQAEMTARQGLETTVNEYLAFVQQVAQGDLTRRLDLSGGSQHEPLVVLGESLNIMADKLEYVIAATPRISNAITTVSEITARSTMLALNASAEAARIGEHGENFAIVAAEALSLKDQSRQATDQVLAILNEFQQVTRITQIGSLASNLAQLSQLYRDTTKWEPARAYITDVQIEDVETQYSLTLASDEEIPANQLISEAMIYMDDLSALQQLHNEMTGRKTSAITISGMHLANEGESDGS